LRMKNREWNMEKQFPYSPFSILHFFPSCLGALVARNPRYSHSIVAGGLDEISYATRFTLFTSFIMRDEMRDRMS